MPTEAQYNSPVGSGSHVVRHGECVQSIAEHYGHFWEKLWNLADNRELRDIRKDPNTLLPSDRITIPDIEIKEESRATEARHRFRRKGVPGKLKIRLLDDGQPRKFIAYRLVVDAQIIEGKTDGDGFLEHFIPVDASQGELIVDRDDGGNDHYHFVFGTLAPIDTEIGQKRRLQNLGYDLADFSVAIKNFQHDHSIEETGAMNDEVKSKLKEVSGQ
ncbi:MAG: hypothetical protein KF757_07125 [Phycisphaeraceae bacterium]|nr:hypothetical protein [Phycisphaeraceae bacterium]MCW5763365.1 hypothetical protein [Phycisphaeraceae bacterium]